MHDIPSYRRIGIIGTGRVAHALAFALRPRSAEPLMLWGRTPAGLDAVARSLPGVTTTGELSTILSHCDLIGIAVTDDALPSIIAQMAQLPAPDAAPFVFHVSGGSGTAPLAPLRARGMTTAAIHPAMTFTGDPQAEVARMTGAHFAVTGSDGDATQYAMRIVKLLGGVPVPVDEAHRPLYHAALCHAANHLVTLIDGAAEAVAAAGVDAPLPLLAPLVRAALDNSLSRGFGALSGPLLRGDVGTIAGHLSAIDGDCPQVAAAYRAMAAATLDRLERGSHAPAPALRDMLGDGAGGAMAAPAPLKLKIQLLCGDEIAIGPGKADLLDAIRDHGSISAAGRAMGMSYRRTWLLVDAMNRCWRDRIVETVPGGGRDRGAHVTPAGEALLSAYRAMQAAATQAAEPAAAAIMRRMIRDAPLAPDGGRPS